MKKTSLLLCGLFLFGVYALPGKVCPSSGEGFSSRATQADRPPCHRGAAAPKSPCGTMVCCLLPDVSREAAAVVVLPSPSFSGAVALPSSEVVIAFNASQRIPFEAQAPPGPSGRLSSSSSSRGPPLA